MLFAYGAVGLTTVEEEELLYQHVLKCKKCFKNILAISMGIELKKEDNNGKE